MKHVNVGVLSLNEMELVLYYRLLAPDKQELFYSLLKKCKDGEISNEKAFDIMNDWGLYQ